MRFFQRRTKYSIQVLVEGDLANKLSDVVRKLSPVYESKFVQDSFFAAAEIYIDLNLAPQERQIQIKEIVETVERYLKN